MNITKENIEKNISINYRIILLFLLFTKRNIVIFKFEIYILFYYMSIFILFLYF